jgi:Putative Actinobacterial Holin-X, holin superfamily III
MTQARPPPDGLPRPRHGTSRGGSTAELVKHLSEQIGKLARDEVRLARLEMMRAGKLAGLGIGMFSGGGLLALYGLAACCLLAAAVIGLAAAVAAWLATLIIGAGLLARPGSLRWPCYGPVTLTILREVKRADSQARGPAGDTRRRRRAAASRAWG